MHLANLLDEKYEFVSDAHTVKILDGGTTAQLLIPIIAQYDYLIMLDCVQTESGQVGDVFFFDFETAQEAVTWQGSAHEVEMLQTLQMMDLMGDRPPIKIVGVVPFVIGSETSFAMTQKVINASKIMEKTVLDHLRDLGVGSKLKNPRITIEEMAQLSYKRQALDA